MKNYIGDSVYGDYSTGDLRLYTDNGEGATNEIIIDSNTLTSLFKFVERCLSVKITVKPAAQNNTEAGQKSLEATFKILEEEMKEIFKKLRFDDKKTKIKIKKGSTITINGATAQLLNDVIVTTNDPDTLMKMRGSLLQDNKLTFKGCFALQ